MASTNKTTNYELSQYVGSDKPTYLTDYNQDMSKIDAGIHAAKSEADTNTNAIGDLSSLTTTAKTSLVAAANEIDADVATNTNNIATNTSNIATNTTHIGTLSNLTTTAKTDLVVAANEINSKVGNVANLTTTNKTSAVAAINEINQDITDLFTFDTFDTISSTDVTTSATNYECLAANIKIAYNKDKSLFKMYGRCYIFNSNASLDASGNWSWSFPSSLRPSTAFTINSACFYALEDRSSSLIKSVLTANISIATDGTITITPVDGGGIGRDSQFIFTPCIYINTDFGD